MEATLSNAEIESFIDTGFVKVETAFSRPLAQQCVDELWNSLGVDRHDPSTWTEPIVRIHGSFYPAVVAAINTDRLTSAIDQLLGGRDQWLPRDIGYGTFPVRFPSEQDPGDAGWHIDSSFGPAPDWRVNFVSRGRALLLLMLFSDVTEVDAPTQIRVGSATRSLCTPPAGLTAARSPGSSHNLPFTISRGKASARSTIGTCLMTRR